MEQEIQQAECIEVEDTKKAIEDHRKNVLLTQSITYGIKNKTRVFFHESVFAWNYRNSTLGGTVLGKKFPANSTYTYETNVGNKCIFKIGGMLFYKSGDKVKEVQLHEKQAQEGKCFVRAIWTIDYKKDSFLEAPEEKDIEVTGHFE